MRDDGIKLRDLVHDFCRHFGLDMPSAGEDGGYRFMYDDNQWLTCFEETDGQVIVIAPLSVVPGSGPGREEALKQALTHNLNAMKSRYEIVGLSEESEQLCLYRRYNPAAASPEPFEHIIEKFVDRLDALRKDIHSDAGTGRRHAEGREDHYSPMNLV